jgi:hypothetical protein
MEGHFESKILWFDCSVAEVETHEMQCGYHLLEVQPTTRWRLVVPKAFAAIESYQMH